MLVGESEHTLDAKHRVFVPKRFHPYLERDEQGVQNVVVTRGFESCLFLFSQESFHDVVGRLRTQAFGGKELRKMQRLFFSNSHASQLDASGRLVIPEKLRNLAGIDREVVIVGCADRAEIWSRAHWDQFQNENDDDFDGLDVVLIEGEQGGGD